MSATHQLEVGLNEHINRVLKAMMVAGGDDALEREQNDTALIIAGILTGAKVAVMQAGALIKEAGLDDTVD